VKRLAAAGALFLASVAGWTALVASSPGTYWQQSDAVVYREAGLAVRHGAALYGQTFGVAHLPFTYPPFAALVFAVLSPLRFPAWQVILAGAGLCCLPLAAHAAVRLAAGGAPAVAGNGWRRPSRTAAGNGWRRLDPRAARHTAGPDGASRTGRLAVAFAVAAVGLWLEPVDLTLHFGQINLILMALVLVDLAAPDTARYKGVAIGIAAGLKLTPLIFVPYLLLTRRVRAAAVSVASFAGTVALGFAVLGRDSAAYWAGQFSRPGDDPVRLVNQSLNGLVLRAFHDGPDAHAAWIVAAFATGAVGIGAAVVAGRRGLELLGVCLCAATGLLVSPISWSHHWVYVLAGLALVVARPARLWRAGPVRRVGALAAAAVLVGLFAWWPLRVGLHGGIDPGIGIHPSGLLRVAPHDNGAELRWTGWQLVYGDAYVLAALAFVLGSAGWLLATGRRPRPEPGAVAAGSAAPGVFEGGEHPASRAGHP
jgi:alpha-1,2-mannosyltransferase